MVRDAIDGARFVEIGAWQGRSTYYMAASIAKSGKNIKFTAVDLWGDYVKWKRDAEMKNEVLYASFLKNIEPVKDYVYTVRCDSSAAAKHFKDDSLDFVFIDGDHTLEGCKRDIDAYYPKLKDGGIMAGDDYTWPGVQKSTQQAFCLVHVYCRGKSLIWWIRKGAKQDGKANAKVDPVD